MPRDGSVVDLLPLATLMTIVLSSIYSGIATPSEASAILIILLTGQFSLALMRDTLMGALRTSTMVCSILIAAAFLSTAMGYLHIPADVAAGIAALNLGPVAVAVPLLSRAGFFLDGNSIVVMSLPIALPLALQVGFDPIWFGVYLVLMVEMAQVTPPSASISSCCTAFRAIR